jgi:hypothetical protein
MVGGGAPPDTGSNLGEGKPKGGDLDGISTLATVRRT